MIIDAVASAAVVVKPGASLPVKVVGSPIVASDWLDQNWRDKTWPDAIKVKMVLEIV